MAHIIILGKIDTKLEILQKLRSGVAAGHYAMDAVLEGSAETDMADLLENIEGKLDDTDAAFDDLAGYNNSLENQLEIEL